jgi:large subunit ribosomal protein L19
MENTTIGLSPVNIAERKALDIRAGDTVKVHQKIQEKGKTRIQIFEGLVLAVKHGKESGGTFTVRKVMSGVGVEKIFPIYSPVIEKIEIVKRSKVRRSKLYYIREKVAREVRRKMRKMINVPVEPVIPEVVEEEVPQAPADAETKDAPETPTEETKTEAPEEKTEEVKEEASEEEKSADSEEEKKEDK